MTTITTRSGKGSPLTNNEVDANFTNLNTDKVEASGDSMTGNLSFGDNNKVILGSGSDLQLYHDGSSSRIHDAGTGDLIIAGQTNIILGALSGEEYLRASENGAVSIKYDNSTKLATTSTGVDVTGTVVSDGLTVDGDAEVQGLRIDAVADVELEFGYANTTHSKIIGDIVTASPTAGQLKFQTSTGGTLYERMRIATNGDVSLYEDTGTTAKFFWDASTERLGIGATSLTHTLHVTGSSNEMGLFKRSAAGNSEVKIDTTTSGDAKLTFANDGTAAFTMGRDNSDSSFRIASGGTLGSNDRLVINSSGSVGIGTSSPSYPLHLKTTAGATALFASGGSSDDIQLRFQQNNTFVGAVGYDASEGAVFLNRYGNATVGLTVNSNNNVGIGTSSPAELLVLDKSSGDTFVRFDKSGTFKGLVGISDSSGSGSGSAVAGDVILRSQTRVLLDTGGTTRAVVDASGNVGIGTSSPTGKLDVTISTDARLYVNDNVSEVGSGNFAFQVSNSAGSALKPMGFRAEDIRFATGSTERMRIDSSGRVGIGTSSPTAGLECINTEGAIVARSTQSSNTNVSLRLAGGAYSGNKATAILLDGVSGENQLYLGGGTSFGEPATDIRFHTGSAGAVGTGTERMRIDSSGNVNIATTSAYSGAKLSVNGSIVQANGTQHVIGTFGSSGLQLIGTAGGDNVVGTMGSSEPLIFRTVSAERMRIDSSGNVGIGTSSPNSYAGQTTLNINSAGVARLDLDINNTMQGFLLAESGYTGLYTPSGSNSLRFGTNNTERMRINASGKVGIGTSSPSSYNSNSNNLVVAGSGNTGVTIAAGTSDDTNIFFSDGTSGDAQYRGIIRYSHSDDAFQFHTAGANERMRIDASGNVGIGTDSPNSYTNYTTLTINGTNGGLLDFETNGTLVGEAFADSTNGIALQSIGSRYIRFLTNGGERMRIDSSGNVLVGTTDVDAGVSGTPSTTQFSFRAASEGFRISQTGTSYWNRNGNGVTVYFRSNGSNQGNINVSSSGTAYNTSSDQRLKDNIVDAPSASDDIDAVQVRSFDWKADGSHQKYGMVAQELQSVAPDAVTGDADSDDMMGVDYSKLVPMLVKEIQSLRARVAQLEGEN